MLITLKADVRPPTAPILGSPTVLGTTSISVPLQVAATDVNGIASYTLEYSTSLNGTYVEATAAAVFPQTVTELSPSTQYFFRARAVDNYGNAGPYSGVVSATTQAVNPGTGLSWPLHVPAYESLIPGVGGYGMNTVAGSGRHLGTPATTIILVNTLATGNTGAAVSGMGLNVFAGTWEYAWRHNASPKVIIPIVSGWVQVQDSIPCQTGTPPRPGYVSYYGQFAPNPGLFLRGANVETNGASNVAVWHLRSYMGDDVAGLGAGARDCFSSGYGQGTTEKIVLINCEFAWSIDEIAGFFRSHAEVTFTGCAFIEPLHVSTVIHPEDGPGVDHGFGPMVGGDTLQAQCSAVSTFRNLWAHTTARNPLISARTFVHSNNLHYNHGRPTGGAGNAVQIVATGASEPNFANILGNGFIRGPNNNTSMVAVSVTGTYPTGSAGYSFANSQFGWSVPASQNSFFTQAPSGYVAAAVQPAAYPGSWGTGLGGVLQWASNPLAPTLTEWHNFVTLMERTVGAQPRWRTPSYGRVDRVFDQIRDRLNGVSQTDQFVDTVAEAGGWFAVPSITINPLNPGSHWHAPLPTGGDRDTPYTSGTFSDGKSRVGYTRLEEWAYEQHLYVTSLDSVAPSVPVSVAANAQSASAIRVTWSASTDTGGVGVSGYRVYRSTSSGGPFAQIGSDVSAGSLQYDNTGLSASTTYYYRVSAFDWNGNESNASAVTSATTQSSSSGQRNVGVVGPYSQLNLAVNPIASIDLAFADYAVFATGGGAGLPGSGGHAHVGSGWAIGGGAYCRINPPTTNQYERGIYVGNLWRNATLGLQELNYRFETRFSPNYHSFLGTGSKYCIVHCRRNLDGLTDSEERPALFFTKMSTADNSAFNRASTTVIGPSQETTNGWGTTVYGDTWMGAGGTLSYYPNSAWPFYLVNDGDTGTFQGNPKIQAGEPITIEHRIVTKAIAGYPRGLIAFRLYREDGSFFERGIPWNWDTTVPLNAYVFEIQQLGCGQFNTAPGPNAQWVDIGSIVTLARDLSSLQPSLGGWLGRRSS